MTSDTNSKHLKAEKGLKLQTVGSSSASARYLLTEILGNGYAILNSLMNPFYIEKRIKFSKSNLTQENTTKTTLKND